MIADYRCDHCQKLLFRGSLQLILTRAHEPKEAIELKCPRCGEFNRFTAQLAETVLKTT